MFLMVLNDGTTYTDLKGCRIVAVEDGTENVEEALRSMSQDTWEERRAWVVREFNEIPSDTDFYERV